MVNKSNVNPEVSIIIPVYNAQEYLQECLDSVLNQTFSDIEVVLVNDGSKDNSGKICDEYASKDSRVTVIHQENAGVSAARNNGISAATGNWLMFVDSDDSILPDAVETFVSQTTDKSVEVVISKQFKDDVVYSGEVKWFDLEKYRDDFYGACIAGPDMFYPVYPKEMRDLPFIGAPWGKFFSGKLIRDNNIRFPEEVRIGEDSVFNMTVIRFAKNVCYVDSPTYVYRVHAGSISTGNIHKKFDEYIAYVNKTEEIFKAFEIKDNLYPYRSVDLSQMIWELANLYGADSCSLKKFIGYSAKLKEFAEFPPCKCALSQMKSEWAPGAKYKIMINLLKKKMYIISIFICLVFNVLLSRKK